MSAPFSFFSKSKTSKQSGSGTTVAVRRVVKRVSQPSLAPGPAVGTLKVVAREGTPASTTSSASSKRKSDGPLAPAAPKRARKSSSPPSDIPSRASSSAPSVPPSEPPTTSSLAPSPLRDVSPLTSELSCPDDPPPAPRECWTEEDGRPGPGFLSCEDVVKGLMRNYIAYFKNLDDPNDTSFAPHPTKYPVAELEYPNTGGCERFVLLQPRDPDHYNPIMCLENSLYTIIEHYLTPEQQSLFGTLPHKRLEKSTDSDTETAPRRPQNVSLDRHPSTVSTPLSARSSSSSSSFCSSLTSLSTTSSLLTSISALSSLTSISDLDCLADSTSSGPHAVDFLEQLRRAISKNNGPLFLKVMDAVNALLRLFKYPPLPDDVFDPTPSNVLRDAIRTWPFAEVPQKVILRIVEEVYQRAVGPNVAELRRYEAFSSAVYGELLPPFVTEIIKNAHITSDTLFLDLGSGVGNVVLQASFTTGCRSYGIELMPGPAKLARSQREQFRIRCRMWGLRMGDVELEEGDMLNSQRTNALIKKADVVLVNNKVFDERLNDALLSTFLDLKDGAVVVSLRPFVTPGRVFSERNAEDPSWIFSVKERHYHAGSVSWSSSGGAYYLHRVDRGLLQRLRENMERESSRSRSTRSSRSRR